MPVTAGDYPRQRDPDSPMAHTDGTVRVHRLVAAEKLGRPLRSDEFVHHINGDPKDNRPENLMVLTNAEHGQLHWASGDWDHLRGPRGQPAFEGCHEALRELRKAAGIKQGELAAVAGITQSHLCELEKGKAVLNAETYRELLEAIDEVRMLRERRFVRALRRVELRAEALEAE